MVSAVVGMNVMERPPGNQWQQQPGRLNAEVDFQGSIESECAMNLNGAHSTARVGATTQVSTGTPGAMAPSGKWHASVVLPCLLLHHFLL